jgi:hypothetical protein
MKMPHPDSWPEPLQIGALLVLLVGRTGLLHPKDIVRFVTKILEEEEAS